MATLAAACGGLPSTLTDRGAGRTPGDRDAGVVLPATGRTVDGDAMASGCTVGDGGSWSDRGHYDPATAPAADRIYDVPLPAGGPHMTVPLPVSPGLGGRALDVRPLVHNLEHGAVAVFVDPVALGLPTLAAVDAWQRQLLDAGFAREDTRAGVFVSVVPADADGVAAVSYRAWDVAVDCDGWEVAQADAFVATVYGERGTAPESGLGPYPEDNDVLRGGPAVLPGSGVAA